MKKRKIHATMLVLLLAISFLQSFSQTIEVSAGQTLFPGLYGGLRYAHPTNSELNIAGGLFLESSNQHNLRYRCFGLDLLAQYSSDRENENVFSFKTSLGTSLQIENEPWVYKDWGIPQKINYGLIGELQGVINLTDAFSISAFGQQKFLFNKILGTTHFIFGLGLSYKLGL